MRGWFTVRVRGHSMAPALRDGDILLVRPRGAPPRIGDIVVARLVGDEVVKRVGEPPHEVPPGSLWLSGDNAGATTDSRSFGAVSVSDVQGIALLRIWPLRRVGRLATGPPV